jgi:hypothetical protein
MAKKKSAAASTSASSAKPEKKATEKVTEKAPKKAPTAKAAPAKTAATKTPSKIATNGDASSASAELGCHQIGETAGALWQYLTDNGECSLVTIKKEIHAPAELIFAAVGWLAREEKLDFTVSGKTVKLSLK